MRTFTRLLLGVTVVAVSLGAILAAGCGRGKPVLHIFTWADYVKPELLRRFEREQRCRVVIDTFDSNEAMYAKIKAGAGGYDVIFPSSYMVLLMHEQGMLQTLRHDWLPNARHVDRDYLHMGMDATMAHSVPYMISYTGIGYVADRVPEAQPSWSLFDRADLAGRMTMLNDMRETIGAALKSLGHSLNTTDEAELDAARNVVLRWKRNLAKFENEQYKPGLGSAEFLVVHGYSGDILQVADEHEGIVFALPVEGFSIASDDMVIPAGARQVELAHAFINFIHDPAVAAENIEYVQYLCPNTAAYALVDEEIRANPAIFAPPELRAKGEVIRDLGADNAKYIRLWDAIKAGE